MKKVAALLVGTMIATASVGASAAPHKLSGPEIKQLLTDKTVHGLWGSTEYWSYFSPDGWTTYKSKNAPHQDGRWGASAAQYCSKWQTGGDTCYNIYLDGKTVIWEEPQSHHRYNSELLAGNQVPAD